MKEKFHEKMVECYIFDVLQEEGALTLLSGFEEQYLGDALFSREGKFTLLEFKAIDKQKLLSEACKKEMNKFSDLDFYFQEIQNLDLVPHILVVGELFKGELSFKGENYARFLLDCFKEEKTNQKSKKLKQNLSGITFSGEKDLKDWLFSLIDKNSTNNFDLFLKYIVLLVKTRLKKATTSGSTSLFEEASKLLSGVKVVVSINGKLLVSSLGSIIVSVPSLELKLKPLLKDYIKHLEQQKQNSQLLRHAKNEVKNWLNPKNNRKFGGPSL